ncbi:MAG TPA: hypothetical protein VE219_03285 [Candidatus Sulfotelmatobacter sp.]|nr:hypothetical protein [Candidatus Sulfotelmatobacter sp.]
MIRRVRFFKRLLADLPRQLRLAYCLLRDPRVPVRNKTIFAVAMGAILTPFIDLPEVVPFVGELDVLALTLLALKVFISSCPDEVVKENEQLIIEQRSPFDEVVHKGEGLVTQLMGAVQGLRSSDAASDMHFQQQRSAQTDEQRQDVA